MSPSGQKAPPPNPTEGLAELEAIVLWRTVNVLRLLPNSCNPPPLPKLAVFPLIVLSMTVRLPDLQIPPPSFVARLPLNVLLVTVSVTLELRMPPPSRVAVFPLIVLKVTVRLPEECNRMPPPSRRPCSR